MKVMDIEGVGPRYAEKLQSAGISTDTELLERGHARKARAEIAETTGIPEKLILEWVNHADLMRVRGIGPEYADLLEETGVDTVPELARRNATNLHDAIVKIVADKGIVRRPPSEGMIGEWIVEAASLGRTIEY